MKTVSLTIQLQIDDAGGQHIGLQGPLNDKILCLGMLSLAKHTLLVEAPKSPSPIAVVQSMPKGGV